MSFLFPQAWYLLPLVIIPWIINLYRYLSGQTVAVPSVFFLERLLKKKVVVSNTNRWLEMLVESLFLLGLIALLSKPLFAEPVLGNNRALVLLDDSPSMRYHYLDAGNSEEGTSKIFAELIKWLTANTYEQIEIIPLSSVNKKEPLVFQGPEELKTFGSYFRKNMTSKETQSRWNISELKAFMRKQLVNRQFEGYDYIIYTDGRKNHFQNLLLEDNVPIEFPKIVNISTLPLAPTIKNVNLERNHFFVGENIELTLEVNATANAVLDDELVLEMRLDNTLMYRKQITVLADEESKTETIRTRFPANLAPGAENRLNAARLLTITLSKNQLPSKPFVTVNRVVNIYSPKTIAILPSSHPQVKFFETLFAYDLERGHLAITSTADSADIQMVLDPAVLATTKYDIDNNYLVFLNPNESPSMVNQLFKKWGFNKFFVDNKKTVSVLDTLETPFITGNKTIPASQYEVSSYFGFDFNQSISKRATEIAPSLLSLVTIQKQPMIFRYQNIGIFNGIGLDNMVSSVNPDHLIWIYEMLFTFFGGKKLILAEPNNGSESWINYRIKNSLDQSETFFNKSKTVSGIFKESESTANGGQEVVEYTSKKTASSYDTKNSRDIGSEFYLTLNSPGLAEFSSSSFAKWDMVFSKTVEFRLPKTSGDKISFPKSQGSSQVSNIAVDTGLNRDREMLSESQIDPINFDWVEYFFKTTEGVNTFLVFLEIVLLLGMAYWLGKRMRRLLN